jgi:hypothetical protein
MKASNKIPGLIYCASVTYARCMKNKPQILLTVVDYDKLAEERPLPYVTYE